MASLHMTPACGERRLCFVGDRLRFALRWEGGGLPPGWQARLRTNLGRAEPAREEIITAHFQKVPLAGASWCDIPMPPAGQEWAVDLPLTEVGYFKAKAYALDPQGRQHWPDGPDFGVSVHPDDCRTSNIIYCAFTRLHGETRFLHTARSENWEEELEPLDERGYAVIPPSGKLRDLTRQLPHIFGTLGCRVLHLLPINPTPTTYARFGRYGSPYACQDLTAIDPALAEFDQRTTAQDQFRELARGVHHHGGKIFLDLVINHTGWGATLWENHPEWYKRSPGGEFESPGAWGNVWRDLVELDQRHPALWAELAEAFVTWCRRGVDGFRCDAGYKVPVHVWQHIVARVRQEYPDTVFLLEGLGGAWEATEALLTEGGMQWAYSELFQNYTGKDVAWYLDYALRQAERVGTYVNYSETHDNNRLAANGRAWSLLRNRLCALTSTAGGFGFTGGVEWLAAEKINVHQCSGLGWGSEDNLIAELAQLNSLLRQHPCFFDGAKLKRLSPPDSPVFALGRTSAEGLDAVLVLVNTNLEQPQTIRLVLPEFAGHPLVDLLNQKVPAAKSGGGHEISFTLAPGAAHCLSRTKQPAGLAGDDYRRTRAQAAWALCAIRHLLPPEKIGPAPWPELARLARQTPVEFLAALPHLDPVNAQGNLLDALRQAMALQAYSQVVVWAAADARRVTPVPAGHFLLVCDPHPFRARLTIGDGSLPLNFRSVPTVLGNVVAFPPRSAGAEAKLWIEQDGAQRDDLGAAVVFLHPEPKPLAADLTAVKNPATPLDLPLVLLTNGRGGMARVCVDLGAVKSKYDCVLGANLHAEYPVDRHVLVKRVRIWVNADGFITPLKADNLVDFRPGPPAWWRFVANAGDGRSVEIELEMAMPDGANATLLRLTRPKRLPALGRGLPPECQVSLTVRFDIEDRNFHWETAHNGGSEHHFNTHCRPLPGQKGFEFTPAADRQLRVATDHGLYHPQPEWADHLPHPVEQSRGQTGAGDAFSPGWFEVPLAKGQSATLAATVESGHKIPASFPSASPAGQGLDPFDDQLCQAAKAFVVRRGQGKTVIAGYPWFLDWGRDTLICARGLLAAGWKDEVREILLTFARFEQQGTLPNTIHGADATNRDTTDAPLWFGVVCEEMAGGEIPKSEIRNPKQISKKAKGKSRGVPSFYQSKVDDSGRTIIAVLASIAEGYLRGTANGIRVDAESGLVWSPGHFTWMDTNYPAGTPREGYPIEIQALWIRLLRQLARLNCSREGISYADLATRAEASFQRHFWLEHKGWFADCLIAKRGVTAAAAVKDESLRSNCLFAVSLGLVTDERARRCVEAARQFLVVPGALRSLAPLPVTPPLPIYSHDGRLLNKPTEPYWDRYEGDEDTRRKPAYHNGTAWTWTFPVFCEALAQAWNFSPPAVAAARAYLGSMAGLMSKGCLGQIPEIVDGDAPHQARGCDAQAWGATEALRVWRSLSPQA